MIVGESGAMDAAFDSPQCFDSAAEIVLSFDVGRKKTGIAIGNTLTGLARPLAVEFGGRSRQLAAIERHIAAWTPQQLVVGLPRTMGGAEHQMSRYCRFFARLLATRFALPVLLVDERLTTQTARALVGNAPKQTADSTAAAVILQDFLRQRRRALAAAQ